MSKYVIIVCCWTMLSFCQTLGLSASGDTGKIMAPTFYMPGLDGRDFFLSQCFTDQTRSRAVDAVVLSFFTTGCMACRREIPIMMELRDSLTNISFYLINIAEGKNKVQKFVDEMQYDLPVLLDLYGIVSTEKYNIHAAPAVVVIGKNRHLLFKKVGLPENPTKYYKHLLDSLLN